MITFMPNIFLLFLALALLEDTGYMARVAFLMDRIMKTFNLSGKSFIPMMVGLGCSVPAIMATRTLENEADRLTTIMVLPLMSCSARLPIYTLIIPAFFAPNLQAPILMGIYLTGFCLMMLTARFLRRHLMPEDGSPLIMELPPLSPADPAGPFYPHVGERTTLSEKSGPFNLYAFNHFLGFDQLSQSPSRRTRPTPESGRTP